MESAEMHNAKRLREIGNLINNVCDTAQVNLTKLEMTELAAAYYKAMFYDKKVLAKALFEQLRNATEGLPYESLESLYEANRISIMELAWCRSYLDGSFKEQ